ncbi:cell wall-binding protein [Lachnospiraceae bacterium 62-35]
MKGKGWAVFALAAAASIGMGISSLAAEGWAKSGDNWVYYNARGELMRDAWRKGADNKWRYLNSDGKMAINEWVDDEYYVDADGIMVSDKWLKIESDQDNAVDGYVWYYLGSSGKMANDAWKKIDGKWYHFDDDGEMETGWILDDMYYCGDNGVMQTGWKKLYPPDSDEYENDNESPGDGDDDDEKSWFYFSANGKKYVPNGVSGEACDTRKVDGVNYCFNGYGEMQTGWTDMSGSSSANGDFSDYRYFGEDGKVRSGWLSLEPPEDISGYDGDVEWFYFSKDGKPEIGPKVGEATANDFKTIKGKKYLFNDRGNPVYGLQKVYTSKNSSEYTAYYFGKNRNNCSMEKGKVKVEEGDGTVSEFYFQDNGKGYTGPKDGYLYYMGKLQKPESGAKYTVVSIPEGGSNKNYVVNKNGKLESNKTVKDEDGVKYTTGANGILQKVDGEAAGNDSYESVIEPVFDEG